MCRRSLAAWHFTQSADTRMVDMRRIRAIFTGVLLTLALCALPAHAGLEMYAIHSDHLGTPRVITDKDQRVVWRASPKPFGEMEVEVEEITHHQRFPGQRYDIESRLHYNYFRDYDPRLGRYFQSDPIGLFGGLNTYGYVFQNPVRFTDPTGEAVPAAIVACLANPACAATIATAARGVAGGVIGGLSAFNELATDPCFDGDFLDSVLAGLSVGFVTGVLPGGGSLALSALRGGSAASFGNAVAQYTKNDGISDFSLGSNVGATVVGAFSAGSGNVVGLSGALGARRSGANLNQALAVGASEGSAVSTLMHFVGSTTAMGSNKSSNCACTK